MHKVCYNSPTVNTVGLFLIYFVYKLTFANGKNYVGMSHTDKRGLFTTRYRCHARSAKTGRDLPIYRAWRKYGRPIQSILGMYATREECAQAEVSFIADLDVCNGDHGYNLMPGGEGMHAPPGSAIYALMREKVWDNVERRRKSSLANKGKRPSPQAIAAAAARLSSVEGRASLRKGWQKPGRRERHAEMTRKQMRNGGADHLRVVLKGHADMRSSEGKERQRLAAIKSATPERMRAMRDKAFSNPENVRKFDEGRAAWRRSESNAEHCKRIAKRAAEACKRSVRNPETGIQYPSQRAMARALGLNEASVSRKVSLGIYERV